MPFHTHSRSHSGYNQQLHQQPTNSIAAGLQQASQALGSIDPTGNLRAAQTTTTSDSFAQHSDRHSQDYQKQSLAQAQAYAHTQAQAQALVHAQQLTSLRNPPPLTSNNSFPTSDFDGPRRTNTATHTGEPSQGPGYPTQSHHQRQLSNLVPSSFNPVPSTQSTPGLPFQQAPLRSQTYHEQLPTASIVPSSLQAGQNAPGWSDTPQSYLTEQATAPTFSQVSTNAQQYTLPTRANTMTQPSHNYSRSSPAGLTQDQRYVPFNSSAMDQQQRHPPQTPSQNQKYHTPQTPTGAMLQSPLALEQIRPRANSSMNEDGMGGTSMFNDFVDRTPTTSNYLAPWAVFAFDWCKYPVTQGNSAGKMAIGSYLEDPHNFIQIVDSHIVPQEVSKPGDPAYAVEYTRIAEATCSYPVTRILWEPPIAQKQSTDLLATSGDHLRLWSLPQSNPPQMPSNTISRSSSVNTRETPPQKLTPLALLSNSKTPEHTAPLTSLDWNTLSPKLIITSSIDTTCTIWDIPTLTAKTQLIAHDKEVFDVRFCAGSVDVFVSCGADGSVRMFDLRSLEHSTIIYEPSEKNPSDKSGTPPRAMSPTTRQQTLTYSPPLLRLAASPHDSHLLATFAADSNVIRVLDVRQPGQALLELRGHHASVNAIEWSPTRRGMLASGADDSLVLVWDLLHSANGAVISEDLLPTPSAIAPPTHGGPNGGAGGSSSASGQSGQPQAPAGSLVGQKGPAASWACEYEIANLSWTPQSGLTGQGGEWLGVAGGRGVWGVKL